MDYIHPSSTDLRFLGWDLLKVLLVDRTHENVFLSPGSVAKLLGILNPDEETFSDDNSPILCALRKNYNLPDWLVKKSLGCDSMTIEHLKWDQEKNVDFINNWVSENTNGMITEMVQCIDDDMAVQYFAATYFKGMWDIPFQDISPAEFRNSDGSKTLVDMMYMSALFEVFENESYRALKLPCGSDSMIIFLPNEESFSVEGDLKWCMRDVQLCLPRWNLETTVDLLDSLMSIGFDDILKPRGDLHISEINHKVVIRVNETGVEAASVTQMVMVDGPSSTFSFFVTKPFFFAIMKENVMTFVGKVNKIVHTDANLFCNQERKCDVMKSVGKVNKNV